MCTGTQYWANIGRVVYGLSEHTLRQLTGNHPETRPLTTCLPRGLPARGRRAIEVLGPVPEVEDEIGGTTTCRVLEARRGGYGLARLVGRRTGAMNCAATRAPCCTTATQQTAARAREPVPRRARHLPQRAGASAGSLVGGERARHRHLGRHRCPRALIAGATRCYRSTGAASTQRVRAALAGGAHLEWLPLETISGCIAANLMRFDLAPGAR